MATIISTPEGYFITDPPVEPGGVALNDNFVKVGTDLLARPILLTVTGTSFDGDPNVGGATFDDAITGTTYQQETPTQEWRKDPSGTWVQQNIGGTAANNGAQRVDPNANGFTYIASAIPGSLDANPVWMIVRYALNVTPLVLLYADGNNSFDNVWNNRLALSYS